MDVQLPVAGHPEYCISTYYIIAMAEASANLARYDGVKYGYRAEGSTDLQELYLQTRSEGFGTEVKRRIMLGAYALSAGYYDAYYRKAQQVRTLIREDFARAFASCDVLLVARGPDHRLPPRRTARRSLADVPQRHLYSLGQSRRDSGHIRALSLKAAATCPLASNSWPRRSKRLAC